MGSRSSASAESPAARYRVGAQGRRSRGRPGSIVAASSFHERRDQCRVAGGEGGGEVGGAGAGIGAVVSIGGIAAVAAADVGITGATVSAAVATAGSGNASGACAGHRRRDRAAPPRRGRPAPSRERWLAGCAGIDAGNRLASRKRATVTPRVPLGRAEAESQPAPKGQNHRATQEGRLWHTEGLAGRVRPAGAGRDCGHAGELACRRSEGTVAIAGASGTAGTVVSGAGTGTTGTSEHQRAISWPTGGSRIGLATAPLKRGRRLSRTR
jgi:hypothetical protein